ncbi:MAG TPA: molybdenum ABC transporter ATP-binding protein [Steroidobacteraceae bacterium]|jgi:molybdate transport system ATP-binding protein|nr:molybdenum ABC transporter ATP-binding protein [Steroidobacteraceae bacterium]
MLRVSVRKRRGDFTLQAAFAAPTPGITALFGRSGSGKSTLVDIISGLLSPDEGEVRLGDTLLTDTQLRASLPVERRRIGYVFQDARLFPHLRVLGNLRYGAQRAAPDTPVIVFDEVVSLLGLSGLLQRRPQELSGGEKQRVALGRALLSQPQLLLLDEPLGSLDLARRQEVLPYLEALRDRLLIPMVYVSHEFEEVLRLATHLVLLDAGRVVLEGPVSEVSLRPELRSIVGPDLTGSVLEGVVTACNEAAGVADFAVGSGTLRLSLRGAVPGTRLRLQLLARDVILSTREIAGLSVRNAVCGTIAAISPDEEDTVLVSVDIGGAIVLARITRAALAALGLHSGQPIWALVKAVSMRGHAFRAPTRPEPPSRSPS